MHLSDRDINTIKNVINQAKKTNSYDMCNRIAIKVQIIERQPARAMGHIPAGHEEPLQPSGDGNGAWHGVAAPPMVRKSQPLRDGVLGETANLGRPEGIPIGSRLPGRGALGAARAALLHRCRSHGD